MITQGLLEILRCPTCERGSLRPESGLPFSDGNGELRCEECGSTYPVRSSVAALMPRMDMTTDAWKEWEEHLVKFQERREVRVEKPDTVINRIAKKSKPQAPFARFTGIAGGKVLDVGCGPGKFRHHLDGERVEYIGLDPIVIPESDEFPLLRALAEYLPFKDGTLSHVVVLAALDHFRDTARFYSEVGRVLGPGGHLHILQSVHEIRGLVSAVKVAAHLVKDAWEGRAVESRRDVPKHLTEYTEQSLVEELEPFFSVVKVERYSATWYSPDKLFLTAEPR